MAATISITDAEYADVPEMIRIQRESMEPDVLKRFLYGHHNEEYVRKHYDSINAVLGKRFTSPTNTCHIHKALDTGSGELLAWSLVRWEDGNIVVPPEEDASDLRTHLRREQMKNWLAACGGKPHVVLGGLYVRPSAQGQGIGSRMVEHIYSKYGLETEPVIVQTVAMSEEFWSKLGWETVACTEIDLSIYGGKGHGYGLHRSPHMLRSPK